MSERETRPSAWQPLAALGLVLVAAIPHYTGGWYGVPVWFVLAVAAGYLLPRWWVLIAAPLPWLVGVGIGLLTGQYAFLGEAWWAVWFLSTLLGAVGMAIGVSARRYLG